MSETDQALVLLAERQHRIRDKEASDTRISELEAERDQWKDGCEALAIISEHKYKGYRDTIDEMIIKYDKLQAREIDIVKAAKPLYDAFLSRHGCFPLDCATNDQRQWNVAMSRMNAALEHNK